MILRKAHMNEAEQCYACIEDAKAYQHSLGFAQWHAGYPTLARVREDIEKDIGYVFEDGEVIGYCAIADEEPAYDSIEGAWKTDRPYLVVHRMAFSQKAQGKGLSKEAFACIRQLCAEKGIGAIRIDTHDDNKVMQHILSREGFVHCGTIYYDGPRLAFEWDKK